MLVSILFSLLACATGPTVDDFPAELAAAECAGQEECGADPAVYDICVSDYAAAYAGFYADCPGGWDPVLAADCLAEREAGTCDKSSPPETACGELRDVCEGA